MAETVGSKSAVEYGTSEIGALAHLYRGEMYRSKIWRTRLDATTNWSVVTVGIALSVTFASERSSAMPLVLVGFLLCVFLFFEARRYRFFDIWRTRVRVMETSFYGPILRGQGVDTSNAWNRVLADDYIGIYFHISFIEAVGRRLRRNYLAIFTVQLIAYLSKLAVHPAQFTTIDEFFMRAAVGPVAGEMVLTICAVFYCGLYFFAIWTMRFKQAAGRTHQPPALHKERMHALTLGKPH